MIYLAVIAALALTSATDFFSKTVASIVRRFKINEFVLTHLVIPISITVPLILLSIMYKVFNHSFSNFFFVLPIISVPFLVRFVKLNVKDFYFLLPFVLSFSKLTLFISLGIFSFFLFQEAREKKHFVYLRRLKQNYFLFPLSIFTLFVCSYLLAMFNFNSILLSALLFVAAVEVLVSSIRDNEKRLRALLSLGVYSLIFPALFFAELNFFHALIALAVLISYFIPMPKRIRYGISFLALIGCVLI